MLVAMSDEPPPSDAADGGWRRTVGQIWHWSVLLVCLIGAAVSLRFTWTAWMTFRTESEAGGSGILWLAIGAGLVALAVLFAWEAVQRVRRLRGGPPSGH